MVIILKKFIGKLAITCFLVILALNCFALKTEAKYSSGYTLSVSSNISNNNTVTITYDDSNRRSSNYCFRPDNWYN